jgi:hypothetical protein
MAKAVIEDGDCPLPLPTATGALVVVSGFPFALGECELNTAGAAAKAGDDGSDGCELCETMIAEMAIGAVAIASGTAPASDEPVDGRLSACGSKVNSGTR